MLGFSWHLRQDLLSFSQTLLQNNFLNWKTHLFFFLSLPDTNLLQWEDTKWRPVAHRHLADPGGPSQSRGQSASCQPEGELCVDAALPPSWGRARATTEPWVMVRAEYQPCLWRLASGPAVEEALGRPRSVFVLLPREQSAGAFAVPSSLP